MKRCLGCETLFPGEGWVCPGCGRTPERREGYLAFAPGLATGDGSDANYAFEAILKAEEKHFWFRNRSKLVAWALRRHVPEAKSFLEVGCGTGYLLSGLRAAFPSLALAATDALVDSLVHAAKSLGDVPLYQVDARRIPFRDEFDAVGAFDVIEHLDEDVAALREMAAVLKPGGALLLTVPQHPWLWSVVDEWSRHRRRYTRRELASKISSAGLEARYLTSFTSLMLPALLLSRRRPARGEFDPAVEVSISPQANALGSLASGLERALLMSGLTLPAGGSLLAVARRPS